MAAGAEKIADVWERYADGQVTEMDVKLTFRGSLNLPLQPSLPPAWKAARSGIFEMMFWFTGKGVTDYPYLCELLRDIFGNPFRPIAVNPSWLTWSGGSVVKLAETIYHDRVFERVPILADALQQAGCHDAAILDHCRQPGPHARGYWVVDLLLGKA